MLTFAYRLLEIVLIGVAFTLPTTDPLAVACIAMMASAALSVIALVRGLEGDKYYAYGVAVSVSGGLAWFLELSRDIPAWLLWLPVAFIAVEYVMRGGSLWHNKNNYARRAGA
ncbi:hypothetical protein [Corynebacterium hindlerae]|uniref:hypothetical protein n=1 Tax=Corynebacterium hindlerae TaxID=699041 RepID=UPI0031B711A6